MNYHDVMEVYKHPISIRYIPRIFSWLLVFGLLFGVSTTAYAETLWVQVPQWSDDWEKCAVDVQMQHVIGMLLTQTIHSVKDLTGKVHRGIV